MQRYIILHQLDTIGYIKIMSLFNLLPTKYEYIFDIQLDKIIITNKYHILIYRFLTYSSSFTYLIHKFYS